MFSKVVLMIAESTFGSSFAINDSIIPDPGLALGLVSDEGTAITNPTHSFELSAKLRLAPRSRVAANYMYGYVCINLWRVLCLRVWHWAMRCTCITIQARSPDNNVGHMTEDDALSCASQSSNLIYDDVFLYLAVP